MHCRRGVLCQWLVPLCCASGCVNDVVCRGVSWCVGVFDVCRGVSVSVGVVVCHGVPGCVADALPDALLLTHYVCRGVSWCVVVSRCRGVSWCVVVCRGVSRCVVVCR